jgi:hypothetical protein
MPNIPWVITRLRRAENHTNNKPGGGFVEAVSEVAPLHRRRELQVPCRGMGQLPPQSRTHRPRSAGAGPSPPSLLFSAPPSPAGALSLFFDEKANLFRGAKAVRVASSWP